MRTSVSEVAFRQYVHLVGGILPIDITGDTALRLARLFGTDPAFWINLQAQYDLETTYRDMDKRIEAEVTPLVKVA